MAAMSGAQIAAAARAGGLTKDIDIAVAIAFAESQGDPQAHNTVPPDDSYGLWQINMLGPLGAQRRATYGLKRNSDLYDPVINAKVMRAISNNGNNWAAWSTYTSQRYRMYLGRSGDTSGSASSSPSGATGSNSLTALADKLDDSHFWSRIGMYLLGFLIIVVGLVLLIGTERARGIVTAAKAVGKVAA